MSKVDDSYIFEPNVIAVIAYGNDPIYSTYKEIIGIPEK